MGIDEGVWVIPVLDTSTPLTISMEPDAPAPDVPIEFRPVFSGPVEVRTGGGNVVRLHAGEVLEVEQLPR